MEKVTWAVALLACGCGTVEGLTSEDIFGLAPNPKVWLYGLVTSARTGAPLPGAAIQVEGFSAASDRNGAYRIDGLDVVETTGSASAQGFVPYALTLNLRPGANARDVALEPQACGGQTCADNQFCDPTNEVCVAAATLTGSVVSACDGAALDARVTIGGWSTCSSALQGKAHFELHNLAPGGPQTLSAGKTGYQAFETTVTLMPGFNAVNELQLTPIGGCSVTPTSVACTCTQTTCQ